MRKIREIMTTDVTCCEPQEQVHQAAIKMQQYNVGSIPVCENEQVVGMITDRDIALRCVADEKPITTPVEHIMTSNVVTASPDQSVDDVARLMSEQRIRRLPIIENGKLAGIVAIGDLAVRQMHTDEAGQALSDISEPSQPLQ
ncbi:CBS domain-containing protein [Numidum massiliense]|uniref:CBS domain-containing protein n=1 Tax=Numidum massiliense TaxID=1522315 RepID=UPI0006D57955|nr:CBS domain-containing protein [Numidum massiliense]